MDIDINPLTLCEWICGSHSIISICGLLELSGDVGTYFNCLLNAVLLITEIAILGKKDCRKSCNCRNTCFWCIMVQSSGWGK